MRRSLQQLFLGAACLAVFVAAPRSNADTPGSPGRTQEQATAPAASSQGETKLTVADLNTLLTNLGYEPVATGDGSAHRITMQHNGWTLTVYVGLFESERYFWIWGIVGDLPANIPAERLIKILHTNNSIGPTHFFIVPRDGTNQLFLGKALENRGIKPSVVRAELAAWGNTVIATQEVWDPTKWTTAPTDARPTTAPAGQP